MKNITFVSAWYNIKSKFNIKIYQKWMNIFLSNIQNFYLIIYTNKESYYVIEPFINNNNIKVIFKEFDEFYCNKYNWVENHKKNDLLNEKSRFNTDWKLNMLWNEKINFLNDVIKNNIFDTEWYGWCDIGYFRNNNSIVNNWPNNKKIEQLDKNKIYYAKVNKNINNICKFILNKNEYGLPKIPIPPNQNSFAGGFFILHQTMYEWWFQTYYNKLDAYFNHNYLIKDDQIIIVDCIINNLSQFCIIEERNKTKDPWFVFQNYLL